ncbi:MAG: aminoglycoside 6-adenylyltransferase [Opitutae bacterium]|nr:aminoglycoside 6-adenylyltransferase [Opitutae bacterium]
MSDDPVMARISAWAASRADISALVQIGSRVQPGATPDRWSDYDFQLISTRPALYRDPAALHGLGETWVVNSQRVFGGADKLTLVFPGGVEADFVILRAVELRIAFAALRAPGLASLWPPPLKFGVRNLKIVACPGWRVVKGGAAWERRYARLGATLPWPRLDEREFRGVCAAFWAAAVWTAKKIARGELRAAQRHFHLTLVEQLWRLLEEEARDHDRAVRPEARRAESWLAPERLPQSAFATGADRATLSRALRAAAGAFEDAAATLARQRGWTPPDHSAARDWLLGELG